MLDSQSAKLTMASLLYRKIYNDLEDESKNCLLGTRATALSLVQDTQGKTWKHYVLKNAAFDWLEKNIALHTLKK